ncbi:MAG TPA: hypothetical protein VJB90_04635 [Candidatus Nanoarchaeia archaeon]|nr:hypothetical protein [Candidatus Nanoarchaeia archaeon]
MALETLFEGETFFEHTPVIITTDSAFLDALPKQISRDYIVEGLIEDFIQEFQPREDYSPGKSDKRLDRLDLFLYYFEQQGFDDEDVIVSINPPKAIEEPPGRTGWTNAVLVSGFSGLYILQLLNGYQHYH